MAGKNHARAVRQIAGFLALAIDREGTPEGARAQAKADELREKYGVKQGQDARAPVIAGVKVPAAWWRRAIVSALGKYFDVASGWVAGAPRMILSGRRCDIEICLHLFDVVMIQCQQGLDAWIRSLGSAHIVKQIVGRKERTRWRESFAKGLLSKVYSLMAANAAARSTGSSATSEDALAKSGALAIAEANLEARCRIETPTRKGADLLKDGYLSGKHTRLTRGIGSSSQTLLLTQGDGQ